MKAKQQEHSPTPGLAQGPGLASALTSKPASAHPLSSTGFPERWQHKALAVWDMNARRGVIETGSDAGKAYLGVTASIHTVMRESEALVLIVVPHEHRRQQWLATFRQDFPTAPTTGIQILTSQETATFTATKPAQNSEPESETRPILPEPLLVQPFALLIADDCFIHAANLLRSPLGVYCERVMGLTAVLPMGAWGESAWAADDGGTQETPSSLLGGVVYGQAVAPLRHLESVAASVTPSL